ncbi:MAG TPA: hypothetical protein VFV50_03605 [Bdellovibrionales bacterium]|nr:hypothetical protein [Bdellovibrionales bacterium]
MMTNQTVETLFTYAVTWAQWAAAFAVDPAEPLAHFVATLAVLALPAFCVLYVLFQIPMIIGDGLTRNMPVLGVLYYRVLCFLVILLVSRLVATGFTQQLAGFGLLPSAITAGQLQLALLAALALAITAVSYKKLENLLSPVFFWKRGYGALDACALGLSIAIAITLF